MINERDLDKHPYSVDEQRVAAFFFEKGTGGGNDPIGGLLASHEYLAWQRSALVKALGDIASGSFPGAGDLAISGGWQPFVDRLQAIARDALAVVGQPSTPGASSQPSESAGSRTGGGE